MRFINLKDSVKQNIFTANEIKQFFSEETNAQISVQLSRFAKKGLITSIKRGLYCLDENRTDEFEIANKLYKPSYISSETALNYYGIIPDIPAELTSTTLTTTKYFDNKWGKFRYLKIKRELFWGFTQVKSVENNGFFLIAEPEKALLDYFYFRKIKRMDDLRLNLDPISKTKYQKYVNFYPEWIRKIKLYE